MRRLFLTGQSSVVIVSLLLAGCSGLPRVGEPADNPVLVTYQNPLMVPGRDPQGIWETLVDVIDDYFRIEREEPVRVVGSMMTEGRLDTFPEVGSTIFEPWRHDSADSYEKIESTLQSIRRRAQVRVVPAAGGYWIEVAVFKELEDVIRPSHGSAGSATFYNNTLTRVVSVVGEQEINRGWIRMGRDPALEQRILAQLSERLGLPAPRPAAVVCDRGPNDARIE